MSINWNLKTALVERFGTQVEAAKNLGIAENRLSYIIRGHIQPSTREREVLEKTLGKIKVKSLLGKARKEATHLE